MSDTYVRIFTMQLRRITEAMVRLKQGIDHAKSFVQEHGIVAKLNSASNLPEGFTKADYQAYVDVLKDIEDFLINRGTFIAKFGAYENEPGDPDQLDRLGKVFWAYGKGNVTI